MTDTDPFLIEGSGSICILARRMVADGWDPDTPAPWHRSRQLLFTQTYTLGWWATHRISEWGKPIRLSPAELNELATRQPNGQEVPE